MAQDIGAMLNSLGESIRESMLAGPQAALKVAGYERQMKADEAKEKREARQEGRYDNYMDRMQAKEDAATQAATAKGLMIDDQVAFTRKHLGPEEAQMVQSGTPWQQVFSVAQKSKENDPREQLKKFEFFKLVDIEHHQMIDESTRKMAQQASDPKITDADQQRGFEEHNALLKVIGLRLKMLKSIMPEEGQTVLGQIQGEVAKIVNTEFNPDEYIIMRNTFKNKLNEFGSLHASTKELLNEDSPVGEDLARSMGVTHKELGELPDLRKLTSFIVKESIKNPEYAKRFRDLMNVKDISALAGYANDENTPANYRKVAGAIYNMRMFGEMVIQMNDKKKVRVQDAIPSSMSTTGMGTSPGGIMQTGQSIPVQ